MDTKELSKFIRKFQKQLRTHIGKKVVFSNNFKNSGKGLLKITSFDQDGMGHLVIVITESSLMDTSNAAEILDIFYNAKVFKDYKISVEKHRRGLKISFTLDDHEYKYYIHIFEGYDLTTKKICGYQGPNGLEFGWEKFVDIIKHPITSLEDTSPYLHRALAKLIAQNVEITREIDWTTLIEEEKKEMDLNHL